MRFKFWSWRASRHQMLFIFRPFRNLQRFRWTQKMRKTFSKIYISITFPCLNDFQDYFSSLTSGVSRHQVPHNFINRFKLNSEQFYEICSKRIFHHFFASISRDQILKGITFWTTDHPHSQISFWEFFGMFRQHEIKGLTQKNILLPFLFPTIISIYHHRHPHPDHFCSDFGDSLSNLTRIQ